MKLGWEVQGKDRLGSLALGLAQAGSAPAEAGCDLQPCSSPSGWEAWLLIPRVGSGGELGSRGLAEGGKGNPCLEGFGRARPILAEQGPGDGLHPSSSISEWREVQSCPPSQHGEMSAGTGTGRWLSSLAYQSWQNYKSWDGRHTSTLASDARHRFA